MDVVERLTLEAAQADTMLACEHLQRYEFAAALCGGRRVLDLCCGSGYGARILAGEASEVVGVDNDAGTIELAQATLGGELSNVHFELGDAVDYLSRDASRTFELIVCFEGLEHLHGVGRALELMREHAQRGTRLIVSVPNGKLFGEDNPHHVTEFGYDEALRAFSDFPGTVMVPQFLAEGSLICPPEAQGVEVALELEQRYEPEYANHFVFCVNMGEALQRAHQGRMQLNCSPVFNRWSEDLKHGAWALRRENARLARGRIGKAGSAAASALAGLADREARLDTLEDRCRTAEARVIELQALLAAALAAGEIVPVGALEPPAEGAGTVEVLDETPAPLEPGEDPNSWEQRRRRAATVLIPWIEQTMPLAGKTVLEYGCGNAAVSCAVAERAGRVIGLDIDPAGLELGNEEIRRRQLGNVELELHPVNSILDAVDARRGEIDVFLLYAVLEHLTLGERLAVLARARDVVKPDGVIVVCETPNRLIYFDHHTAQMPFFHLLPDELAAEYYPHSDRPDFKAAMQDAAVGGREKLVHAIVRWGRGVSFHEFELVFGDLGAHVIGSSYDPLLFGERPVHADEVILARYLDRWRPDLAPAWSRYWLDLILSPRPVARRAPMLRPWTAETTSSSAVSWTRWENLYLHGPQARLEIELPHPTTRLVVSVVAPAGEILRLQVSAQPTTAVLDGEIRAAAPHAAHVSFTFQTPSQRFTLAASRECHVAFVGYED